MADDRRDIENLESISNDGVLKVIGTKKYYDWISYAKNEVEKLHEILIKKESKQETIIVNEVRIIIFQSMIFYSILHEIEDNDSLLNASDTVRKEFEAKVSAIIKSENVVIVPGNTMHGIIVGAVKVGMVGRALRTIQKNKDQRGRIISDFTDFCVAGGLISHPPDISGTWWEGLSGESVPNQKYIDDAIAEAVGPAVYSIADPEKLIAEREAAEKLLADAKSRWTHLEKELTELEDSISAAQTELLSQHDEMSSRIGGVIRDAEMSFKELDERTQASFAEHQKAMAGSEAAYETALAFKAPAKVWDKKARSHRVWAVSAFTVSFLLVVGLAGSVVVGVGVFFKSDFYATTLVPNLFLYAVFLTLIVCGFVLIRLFIRAYNSNKALSDDGLQRSALMQAYLSLVKEGGGEMSDNEKVIILQALFRSPDFAAPQDGGQINHPVEVILNRVRDAGKSGGA